MRWPRYPKYKASGVEWLGDVPEHWELPPLIQRYTIDLGKMLNEDKIRGDNLRCYLRNVDVQWDRINIEDLPEMDIRPSEIDRYTVREGDLLVCEGGDVGRAAIVDQKTAGLAFQKALHRLRPKSSREAPRFLFYTLAVASSQGVFLADGNPNTIPHLTGEKLARYRFPQPPGNEQQAIASFLDDQAGRIKELVGKKQLLIDRLKEKRTALISRTVTRGLPPDAARAAGLDPHPKLKPSGVEWLGDVPLHWRVTKLKHAARRIVDCPHETPTYSDDGEFAVIRTSDLGSGKLDLSNARRVDEEEFLQRTRRERLTPEDIVYGREGERWGNAASVPSEPVVCLGQRMMQMRAARHFDPRFLMWHLNANCVYDQGAIVTLGATSPHVNVDTIRNYWLVEPPLTEQRAIGSFLDRRTTRIEQMVEKVQLAIERLLEYRSALITAAVTGKIDVRNASGDN